MGRAPGRGLLGLDEQRVAMTGQREGGRDWTGRGWVGLGRQNPTDDGEGSEERDERDSGILMPPPSTYAQQLLGSVRDQSLGRAQGPPGVPRAGTRAGALSTGGTRVAQHPGTAGTCSLHSPPFLFSRLAGRGCRCPWNMRPVPGPPRQTSFLPAACHSAASSPASQEGFGIFQSSWCSRHGSPVSLTDQRDGGTRQVAGRRMLAQSMRGGLLSLWGIP